ncbi:MAG: GreA/GreB family elongation factor [Lentisphaerales bacterium]|nr:GreA/GreB family elongation factor [Lentisphaerales bacterium]
MNKEDLLTTILTKLKKDLELANEAVNMAYESATHEENVAECKYDTKGLEASYLVQGQARRAEELEQAVEALISLKIRSVDKVMLNALVTLKNEQGASEVMFIAPASGGVKIDFEDQEVVIMTPASPLGRALLGKTAGDSIEVQIGKKVKGYRVLEVN